MAAPRYVAEKVGDQYVLVPQGQTATGESKTKLWVLTGVLGGLGLMQRGVVRLAFLSLATLTAGVAASGMGQAGDRSGKAKVRGFKRGPSHAHEESPLRPVQAPSDAVEESSMESFPASDPPARMTPSHND